MEEVMKRWLEAFNTRNARMGADLYHEDATIIQQAFGFQLKGKDEIYKDLEQFFRHNPDNETHLVNLVISGEWAALEWSGRATFYAHPGQKGVPFELNGCGFFRIVDGKIKEQRGYFDKATWFKQVGLPIE
jgi:steroid delta-isomerase-like uncharacterized protein